MEITCPNCEHRFFATTRRVRCDRCAQEFDVWAVLGTLSNGSARRTVPLGGAERDPCQTTFGATPDEILELPAPAPIESTAPETSPVLDETFSSLPPEALAKLMPPSSLALMVSDNNIDTAPPPNRNWLWGVGVAVIALLAAGGFYLLGALDSPTERVTLPAVSAAAGATSGETIAAAASPSAAETSLQQPTQPPAQQSDESAAKAKPTAKPTGDAPAATEQSAPSSRPRIVAPADPPPGNFALQVAARPSEAEAKEIAARLRDAGAVVRLVRVELPGRGTWFRVQVGAFETRAEAERYAAQMKRDGKIEDYLIADLRPR